MNELPIALNRVAAEWIDLQLPVRVSNVRAGYDPKQVFVFPGWIPADHASRDSTARFR
jgi:hypothetical protein